MGKRVKGKGSREPLNNLLPFLPLTISEYAQDLKNLRRQVLSGWQRLLTATEIENDDCPKRILFNNAFFIR